MAEGPAGLAVRIVAPNGTGPSPLRIHFAGGAMPVQFVDGISGPSGIPVIVDDGTDSGPGGLAVSEAGSSASEFDWGFYAFATWGALASDTWGEL